MLATAGRLACEVCKFDFEVRYGALGKGFCEVHHKLPLSMLNAETAITIDDMAIVCSNCHRMIHADGVKTITALRRILRKA